VSSAVARAAVLAAGGAAMGAVWVVLAYSWHPALTFEMDRELPRRIASGLYPVERSGDLTFAWTTRRADIKVPGLSRRMAWTCAVRLRGARSDPTTQPTVDVTVDGITAISVTATNDFQDVQVALPIRDSGEGAVVSIASSRTIVPGPSDSRELGVQVDRAECRPAGGVLSFPPWPTVRDAALASAIFGAAFALAGAAFSIAATATGLLAVVQSFPLSAGPAPYIGFSGDMVWFALWIALLMAGVVRLLERWRGSALEHAASVAVMFSSAALYVKLLGLLHPSKPLVDAVFHAHRFEGVMGGHYFFTQPMPGGVSFPYAIGLYVFAAPWSALARDHVTLLRVVVCAAETVAALLLYPLIARAWNDRIAAVLAVVLFSLVPLIYGLVGNANLTNAFGEAIALATIATASMIPSRGYWGAVGLFLLSALAFLSHVSTFAVLAVSLTTLCVLYRWRGDPALHRTAWTVFGVTILAFIVALVVYYGHFIDVYRAALRVRADSAVSQTQNPRPAATPPPAPAGQPLPARVADALGFAVRMIGWPVCLLALVGVWRLWADGARDRAALAIYAWGVACVAFLGVAVMRVDAPFQRYAAEFFGRVLLATCPAAAMLAARGASWGLRGNTPTRTASAILLCCCGILAVQSWTSWFY
jgi:hypothetical protein